MNNLGVALVLYCLPNAVKHEEETPFLELVKIQPAIIPFDERKGTVLKDSSHLEGELLFATPCNARCARLDKRMLLRSASRASDADSTQIERRDRRFQKQRLRLAGTRRGHVAR